ncbi:hypothetical protein DRN62_00955 [Nanoarchaeota archaeon]|nr:MAG: hypothetical protein DRN62_00955 [Nanoarchaeota archaeon]
MIEVPFQLIISILIIAFILSISSLEISLLLDFKHKKELEDSVQKIGREIEMLVGLGEYGSSSRVNISFSKGVIEVDEERDEIVVRLGNWKKVYALDVDVLYSLEIDAGRHEIELHYGPGEWKENTIIFS